MGNFFKKIIDNIDDSLSKKSSPKTNPNIYQEPKKAKEKERNKDYYTSKTLPKQPETEQEMEIFDENFEFSPINITPVNIPKAETDFNNSVPAGTDVNKNPYQAKSYTYYPRSVKNTKLTILLIEESSKMAVHSDMIYKIIKKSIENSGLVSVIRYGSDIKQSEIMEIIPNINIDFKMDKDVGDKICFYDALVKLEDLFSKCYKKEFKSIDKKAEEVVKKLPEKKEEQDINKSDEKTEDGKTEKAKAPEKKVQEPKSKKITWPKYEIYYKVTDIDIVGIGTCMDNCSKASKEAALKSFNKILKEKTVSKYFCITEDSFIEAAEFGFHSIGAIVRNYQ